MLLNMPEKRQAGAARNLKTAAPLSPLETEIIDFFVELARLTGQPRSLAEMYGLLFISNRALAMDDFIERLRLSKGSASQGLKLLRNMGAVKMVYVPGDRRMHYEAVAELSDLAARFLRDQVGPRLNSAHARLERIAGMVADAPAAERIRINGRLTRLRIWGRRGKRLFPMVVKMISG